MKKINFLLLCVCMVLSCKKEDQIPSQLLKNSDMELTDQKWVNSGTGGAFVASWTTDESYSPTHSLKLSSPNSDPDNFWYFGQGYSDKIPIGEELTLTAKIKGDNLVGAGVAIAIRCDGDDPNLQFETSQDYIVINGTFNWTTYTVKLSNVSLETTGIMVYLSTLPSTTGTAYFDDVTLTHK